MKPSLLLLLAAFALGLTAPSLRAADLVVKGFSLGMPAAKALELLNTNHFKLLGAPKLSFVSTNDLAAYLKDTSAKITEEKLGRYGEQSRDVILEKHYAGRDGIKGNGVQIFLQGGKVTKFEFTRDAVDRLFGANDLDGAEFAALFAEAYQLPELRPYAPKSLAGERGWSRKSLDGWHVQVTDGKQLTISAISKAAQRRFD